MTPSVRRLAERLGVQPVDPDEPPRAIEFRSPEGERWDINELMYAFLDRVEAVSAALGVEIA